MKAIIVVHFPIPLKRHLQRVKYSTAADSRNKFGLRELIAEPWQRIPRYTLMFNTMLKHMAMNHPQRRPLEEAIQCASQIARAETDAETKRMAIMHCLSTSIDDFPMQLISNSRHFVDCIDVQDVIAADPHAPISSNGPAGAVTLHCTLFLFDDKLVIVKRPSEKSGRALAGLDQLDKVTRGGILPSSMRKSGLVCKGVVDITDVVATDVGGAGVYPSCSSNVICVLPCLTKIRCVQISISSSKMPSRTSRNDGAGGNFGRSRSCSLPHRCTLTR